MSCTYLHFLRKVYPTKNSYLFHSNVFNDVRNGLSPPMHCDVISDPAQYFSNIRWQLSFWVFCYIQYSSWTVFAEYCQLSYHQLNQNAKTPAQIATNTNTSSPMHSDHLCLLATCLYFILFVMTLNSWAWKGTLPLLSFLRLLLHVTYQRPESMHPDRVLGGMLCIV